MNEKSQEVEDMYPSAEETALWVALNRAQRSVYVAIDSALKAKSLPPLRWYDVLWEAERAGTQGLRAFELEKSLLFEQSNLSRLLRRIVGEDLLEESVCQTDQRGKVLCITPKGRQVRKQMWKTYGPLIHSHMSSDPDRHSLGECAEMLNSLVEQPE